MYSSVIAGRNWRNFWRGIIPLAAGGLPMLIVLGREALALEAGLVFAVASTNFFFSAKVVDIASSLSKSWAEAAFLLSFILRLTLAGVFFFVAFLAGLEPHLVAIVYLAAHLSLSALAAVDFCSHYGNFSKEEKTG